jgi:hypothetical protein
MATEDQKGKGNKPPFKLCFAVTTVLGRSPLSYRNGTYFI